MYTLDSKSSKTHVRKFYFQKRVLPYLGVTLCCMLFAYAYSLFSHGVTSPYMSYMFFFPLVFGAIGGTLCMIFKKSSPNHFFATHLYHTGVVALLLSSMLRGVFEIAGTASVYQTVLAGIGIVAIVCGALCFIIKK